jgi:hypothetical protein
MSKRTVAASFDKGESDGGDSEPPPRPTPRPQISPRYALSWPHVLFCGFFGLLFWFLNVTPLFHSDVWGHVLYGQWILEHGALPVEDPFIPLAQGVKIVDNAWLAQVIFAFVYDAGGAEAMSSLFAVTVTATYLLLAGVFYLQTGRVGVATCGAIMVLLLAHTRVLVIRPEMFGALSFAGLILLCQLVRRPPWRKGEPIPDAPTCPGRLAAAYAGIPLVMVFWANTHGSFPIGLVFLGCHALGGMIETAWRTRSFSAVFGDRMVRRWMILTQLAAAAVLLNPDTIDAYINVVSFGSNPNLEGIEEWAPIHLRAIEAPGLLASLVVLLFAFRHGRVVIRPAQVLLLGVFTIAFLFNVRVAVWYAFVFGYVMVPHLEELLARKWPKPSAVPAVADAAGFGSEAGSFRHAEFELRGGVFGRSYIHTLVCALLLWMGFALSPSSLPLLGGKPRTPERLYNNQTPLGAAAFLREHPPQGLVWNSAMWGDWLLLDGPPGLKPFVNTNAIHVVPPRVWRDYRRIAGAARGWPGILDKYRVDTMIVSKKDQPELPWQVRTLGGDWAIVYEDPQAIVVSREPGLRRAGAPRKQ